MIEPAEEEQVETLIRIPSLKNQESLPNFITQFKGQKWFDELFPNANPLVCVIFLFVYLLVKLIHRIHKLPQKA